MWQAYPYGHTKLKLNKDLKTAEAHLRISLIDSEQIENMNRIYNDRKDYYRIDSHSFTVPQYVEEEIKEEATTHLSYKEKVDLYRQRLQQQKLQHKYNNLFKKTEKRKYKMRKPILHKMLQAFEQNHKHQDNIKVIEDLKQSQKNLQMIKINTNRRAHFKKASKNASMLERPRFISLQNGLPQKQSLDLPDWRDFIQGKYAKPDPSASRTNLLQLQNKLDTFIQGRHKPKKTHGPHITHMRQQQSFSPPPNLKEKVTSFSKTNYVSLYENNNRPDKQKEHGFTCQRCIQQTQIKKNRSHFQEDHISRPKSYNTHIDMQRKKLFSRQASKKAVVDENNISKTAQKIFTKSQNCSKEVIKTMTGFYQFKSNKKEDYKKMVFHLKNDRPLTSDIRRKNYKVIGQENIQEVKKYRVYSEHQRLKLKQKNYELYKQLLHSLAAHNIEQLPLSGKIMQRVRRILESNYIINEQQFEYITQPALYEERDVKSEYLIKRIQALMNDSLVFV